MLEQAAIPSRPGWMALRPIWPPIVLAALAIPLAASGYGFMPTATGQALLGAACSVFLVAFFTGVSDIVGNWKLTGVLRGAAAVIENDPSPSFCSNSNGRIVAQNAAAIAKFGNHRGDTMAAALSGLLVNAPAVVFRQESAAVQSGQASETVFTRDGHVRVTTHLAGESAIWRIEETGVLAGSQGDAVTLPMLVASDTGSILSLNTAMRDLLGHRPRALNGIFGDAAVQSGSRMILQTVEGSVTANVIETRTADATREIFVFGIGPEDGAFTGSSTLFDALPVAALLVRADGIVHAHNDAARHLLEIEPDEDAMKIGDLIEGPGRLAREWMKDILDERASNRSEIVRMLRSGDERSVKITVTVLPGSAEPRLLAVLQDATEVQDLHTQFAQSQKMQAIGELAGGVAHDFNNLLTAITGHCDLLLLRHDQGDQDYADLVQIHQNANRAASLVGQLLAFSRKQTMKPELLDLRDTMAELTHLLNRLLGERVKLELRQDTGLQPIWADRRLLDQVLMNLVVNARDAMPEGGPVRITSRMARLSSGLQRNNAHVPPGTYVVIEVSDEGIGIPSDRLSRIFEPFYTTKRVGEGTGLGLSMAYGIMKQSGGYIFCDSTQGEGTTFSLFFPAHDWPTDHGTSVATKSIDAPDEATGRSDSGVILLVEDEAPVRAFASRALRLKGYSVLEAENGEEALEVLEDDELEIDVFVTDMIMPGMGGPDWVREALVNRPDVGVVFTSGYAEDAYGKFPDIPQAVFLAKPFSLADLTETVQREMP